MGATTDRLLEIVRVLAIGCTADEALRAAVLVAVAALAVALTVLFASTIGWTAALRAVGGLARSARQRLGSLLQAAGTLVSARLGARRHAWTPLHRRVTPRRFTLAPTGR